ncbi:MAG: transcriptional regulator PpsR [Geminicoccaceae bacterium]|nr:MAG: transcriptional regulator PpsR [Geminicoccaceae bacterium]
MKQLRAPQASLGDLDAETAAAIIAAAGDVALVVDGEGVILDLAFDTEEPALAACKSWRGRPWAETVTVESRPKLEALMREAAAKAEPRWRQLNHPSTRGADLPMLYVALDLGGAGRIVAIGRNLQAIASLQQRLVDAQQAMERDYARLRHVETRYRLLFQMSAEALLIVDAATQKVVEANPAAARLLRDSSSALLGRTFPEGFDGESQRAAQALLAGVRATGRSDETRIAWADGRPPCSLSAALFRQENASLFLVRLAPIEGGRGAAALPTTKSRLLEIVELGPDGFVVTSTDGRILAANAAFLDLAQLATEEQARGEPLDRWLGRRGVDLNVLIANLRERGVVRLFATQLNGEYGSTSEVEVSAVSLVETGPPCFGFAIRNVGRRLSAEPRPGRELPRSVEQLTELVGRVSLKDLVRETTDMIERLYIEAALEMTNDNRASAAEMLGLSRQSLYVKLRRYGLMTPGVEDGDDAG